MTLTSKSAAPYGSWSSKISSESLVEAAVRIIAVFTDAVRGDVYWIESRPKESGRYVVVKHDKNGDKDFLPKDHNARTRVHEYGGAAATAHDGILYYTNFGDQLLYKYDGTNATPLTKEGHRYADFVIDEKNARIVSVREDHTDKNRKEPINSIVSISLKGDNEQVLVSGNDFYSSPRISPKTGAIAYVTWNHPNMPWDNTKLCVLENDEIVVIAQGEESCAEPVWSPDGRLFFVTDRRAGWWNIHWYNKESGHVEYVLAQDNAEFTGPAWTFGERSYVFKNQNEMVVSYNDKEKGGRLGVLHLDKYDSMSYIKGDWTSYSDICLVGDNIYFIGSSPTKAACVVQYNLVDHATTILKLSSEVDLPLEDISIPRTIEFPTENGLTAFGIFYEPKNSQYEGMENEKPPLLVKIHGGPTAAAGSEFKKGYQYWTTRGFAILDVNYGGSTGYGREYRQRLNGNWGVVDVDDCCNGARYLVKHGWVDEKRLAIDGGSAGGYTTLACLAFRSVFSAGASHFGVSDLEALAQETHKFEARYLDNLIGEYPKSKDVYVKRSPIHHVEGFDAPLALFQGDEDVVVPPNQSQMIYEKVKAKGLTVSYTLFKGEQHGFRKAENIRRALDGEFYFYSKVFGFTTAENLDNIIEIDNLKK